MRASSPAASREILEALGRDAADPGAVLDTVSRRPRDCAGRRPLSFSAATATCSGFRGSPARPRRTTADICWQHPIAWNRSVDRRPCGQDKCTVQIPDVLADADYGRSDLQSAHRISHAAIHADDPARMRSSACWRCGELMSRLSMIGERSSWKSSPCRERSCCDKST